MFLESDFKVCSFFKVLMAHQAINANDKIILQSQKNNLCRDQW